MKKETINIRLNDYESKTLKDMQELTGLPKSKILKQNLYDVKSVNVLREVYLNMKSISSFLDELEVQNKERDFSPIREGMMNICTTLNS